MACSHPCHPKIMKAIHAGEWEVDVYYMIWESHILNGMACLFCPLLDVTPELTKGEKLTLLYSSAMSISGLTKIVEHQNISFLL